MACSVFYERVKEVRDYHRRYPNLDVTEVRCLGLLTSIMLHQHRAWENTGAASIGSFLLCIATIRSLSSKQLTSTGNKWLPSFNSTMRKDHHYLYSLSSRDRQRVDSSGKGLDRYGVGK